MKLSFNDMLYAFSYALDCIEHELVGVTTHHGKRVAYLSILMGEYFSFDKATLMDLAACAVLHDNALTEYIQTEYNNGINLINNKQMIKPGDHCSMGEKNMKYLSLCPEAQGAVLYHHENADGSGPFGKKDYETPLFAQIIHMADQIDSNWDLSFMNHEKYAKLKQYILKNKNIIFSPQCADAFFNNISCEAIMQMEREKIDVLLGEIIENTEREYSNEQFKSFATLFANIIDYKSKFTKCHSLGIAEKAAEMSKYYGFSEDEITKMYVAGALHDIGKLVVDTIILEKPDKLTEQEYKHIQNHAYHTYDILRKIKGIEDITNWASLHHEKLNGKGYPFGKKADELGQKERMMACLDIYQALTEERPYKKGMKHEKAVSILKSMVSEGALDSKIVSDIDKLFA